MVQTFRENPFDRAAWVRLRTLWACIDAPSRWHVSGSIILASSRWLLVGGYLAWGAVLAVHAIPPLAPFLPAILALAVLDFISLLMGIFREELVGEAVLVPIPELEGRIRRWRSAQDAKILARAMSSAPIHRPRSRL